MSFVVRDGYGGPRSLGRNPPGREALCALGRLSPGTSHFAFQMQINTNRLAEQN